MPILGMKVYNASSFSPLSVVVSVNLLVHNKLLFSI